jgi:MFS transporter, DHA1 family, inner membrane transport protein
MTASPSPQPAQTTILASAFIAAGFVEVTAAIILNTLPAIVGALTNAGRVDAAMAGYIVAIDLAAQVAGTLLFMSQGGRRSWSTSYAIGLALMVVGNFLSCLSVSTLTLIATRLVAGVGAGILRSAYFVLLARAKDPARAVAVLCVAQILSTSAAFAVFPSIIGAFGWSGPYLLLSVVGLCMFATAPWWPKPFGSQQGAPLSLAFGWAAALSLVATFINYAALEGVWAFMDSIGRHAGASPNAINSALALVAIPGLAAMLLVPVVSARLSVARALTAGLLLTLGALYVLTINSGLWTFGLSLALFYFVWNLTVPFQFAAVAGSDRSGAAAAAFPAADGLGMAAGPAIAGKVVLDFGVTDLLVLTACCAAVSIGLFVAATRHGRSRLFVDGRGGA